MYGTGLRIADHCQVCLNPAGARFSGLFGPSVEIEICSGLMVEDLQNLLLLQSRPPFS
jgi:hypothetical protein